MPLLAREAVGKRKETAVFGALRVVDGQYARVEVKQKMVGAINLKTHQF